MTYYITPNAWRQDEYRDVLTAEEIAECYDVWSSVATGDIDDRGEVVYRAATLDEAMDECIPIEAPDYATAVRIAMDITDDLSPDHQREMVKR